MRARGAARPDSPAARTRRALPVLGFHSRPSLRRRSPRGRAWRACATRAPSGLVQCPPLGVRGSPTRACRHRCHRSGGGRRRVLAWHTGLQERERPTRRSLHVRSPDAGDLAAVRALEGGAAPRLLLRDGVTAPGHDRAPRGCRSRLRRAGRARRTRSRSSRVRRYASMRGRGTVSPATKAVTPGRRRGAAQGPESRPGGRGRASRRSE